MTEYEPPDARACERCGREEVWSLERSSWIAADPDDEAALGRPHCVHVWDVTGTYNPIVR